jgi:hypothetical protein
MRARCRFGDNPSKRDQGGKMPPWSFAGRSSQLPHVCSLTNCGPLVGVARIDKVRVLAYDCTGESEHGNTTAVASAVLVPITV